MFVPIQKAAATNEPITVFVGDSSIVAGNDGPKRFLEFPVTLSRPSTTEVTFLYEVRNGTAKRNTDYTDNGKTKTIRFNITPSGYTQTQQYIKIPLTNVPSSADTKDLLLTIHNPSSNVTLQNPQINGAYYATGRILPSRAVGGGLADVGIGSSSTLMGKMGGPRKLRIPITLSKPSATSVSVKVKIGHSEIRQINFIPNYTGFTPTVKYIAVSNEPSTNFKKSVQIPIVIISATNATSNSSQVGYAVYSSDMTPNCTNEAVELPSPSLFSGPESVIDSNNDVWKLEQYPTYPFRSTLQHYDGLGWNGVSYLLPTPELNSMDTGFLSSENYLNNVSATANGEVYMTGTYRIGGARFIHDYYPFNNNDFYPVLIQYANGNWKKYTNMPVQFDSIYAVSDVEAWGLKNNEYYHFDGAIWQKIPSCN